MPSFSGIGISMRLILRRFFSIRPEPGRVRRTGRKSERQMNGILRVGSA